MVFTSLAAGLGCAIGTDAALWPLGLLPFGLLLSLRLPGFRLAFVILGGLTVLQSTGGLSAAKALYLAGVVFVLAVPFIGAGSARSWLPALSSWRRATSSMGLVVLFSLVFGVFVGGNAAGDALRDATPYLLFCAAPLIVQDAVEKISRRTALGLLVLAGSATTLATAMSWLLRRGFAPIPAGYLGLSSFFLPLALFAYASSRAMYWRERGFWLWAFLATGVLGLLLATGTRSVLLFLIAPAATLVYSMRRGLLSVSRLVLSAALGVLGLLVLLPYAASLLSLNPDTIFSRLASVFGVLGDGPAGQSFAERSTQTSTAFSAFAHAPIMGVGLGHRFVWTRLAGTVTSSFQMDTPIATLAKFGILGSVVVIWAVLGSVLSARVLGSDRRAGAAVGALVGYTAAFVAHLGIVPVLEDKGAVFGLVLLMTLAVLEVGNQRPLVTCGRAVPAALPELAEPGGQMSPQPVGHHSGRDSSSFPRHGPDTQEERLL